MIKKLFAIWIAFAICISPVFALSIPKQDESIYVNDYSDVLNNDTENELISINQNSDYKTGGYVVVATFDFVDEDLYDFSYRLFNEWGVGSSEYNNGILLVLDIGNDNYCYILGTGIEQILSDYEARSIIDTYMEPDFAKKDYDAAVLKTTQQFLQVIADEDSYVFDDGYYDDGDYDDGYYYDDEYSGGIFSFIGYILLSLLPDIFFLIMIIIVVTSIIRSRRRYRHMGSYVPPRRTFWGFGPLYHPHHDHSPRRPMDGTFRSHGSGFHSRPSSSGGFRSSSSGGFRSSSSGGFRSSGGGRSHSGGSSRGGGGTRR